MTLNIRVADDQFGAFHRKVAAIADRLDKSLTFEKVMDALQRIHDGEFEKTTPLQSQAESKLLELLTTVSLPGAKRFVASENFKVDTSRKAKVKIAWMGDNFKKLLTKVEEDVPASDLKIHKLTKPSVDKPIRDELGAKHKTYLADLWAMLKKQPNGEEGDLLVDGRANIFYIFDEDATSWAVDARWYADDGGWRLDANSVSRPGRWYGGYQVVSR
ncbi:MAG: hypothetical protein AAB605_02320 [Patescibacteria group bacterium]